jgi:hypothetical protein
MFIHSVKKTKKLINERIEKKNYFFQLTAVGCGALTVGSGALTGSVVGRDVGVSGDQEQCFFKEIFFSLII